MRTKLVAFACMLSIALFAVPGVSASGDPVEVNSCFNGGVTVTVLGDDVLTCFEPGAPSPKELVRCLVLAQPPTSCL